MMRRGLGHGVAVALTFWTLATSSCESTPNGPAATPTAQAAASLRCASHTLAISDRINYTDRQGRLWMIGNLTNTSGEDLLLARICIAYNTESTTRTEEHYAGLLVLRSQEQTPFRIMLEGLPADGHNTILLSADAQPARDNPEMLQSVYRDLQVSDITTGIRAGTGAIEVRGVITNTGQQATGSVYVSVGLYNANNALVGVAEGNITGLETIEPGESRPFTILTNRIVSPVTDLRAQAIAEGRAITDD